MNTTEAFIDIQIASHFQSPAALTRCAMTDFICPGGHEANWHMKSLDYRTSPVYNTVTILSCVQYCDHLVMCAILWPSCPTTGPYLRLSKLDIAFRGHKKYKIWCVPCYRGVTKEVYGRFHSVYVSPGQRYCCIEVSLDCIEVSLDCIEVSLDCIEVTSDRDFWLYLKFRIRWRVCNNIIIIIISRNRHSF